VPDVIANEAEMLACGKSLSLAATDGIIIFLHGELGAGKTTFTRGFLRGLGFEGRVKSPTYTLVESYELEKAVVLHFDLYRIQHPSELDAM
jgi:tRNA threonylcarbamoyladenosine biosynthesis protein TsaE